jgi:hypothetical protein
MASVASDVCLRSRYFETWFGTLLSSSGAGSRPRGTEFVENSNFLGLHCIDPRYNNLVQICCTHHFSRFGYSSSEGCCSTHVRKQNSRKTEGICGFGSCRGVRYAWRLGSFWLSERKCRLLEKPWQMESGVGTWSQWISRCRQTDRRWEPRGMEQAYSEKARELLKDLVRVCSNSPQAAAALIHDNLEQLWPSLQGASSQSLPKVSYSLSRRTSHIGIPPAFHRC